MTVIAIVMTGVSFFLIGTMLGNHYAKAPLNKSKKDCTNKEICRFMDEEYRNFLNYDGSEQA